MFGSHKFWLFHQTVMFVRTKIPTSPIFIFLSTKPNETFNFVAILKLLIKVSSFRLKACASNISIAKFKTLCLPFSISESKRNCLHVFNSSFKLSSSTPPINCVTSRFWSPMHFLRCAPSVCVIARIENHQKPDDKTEPCKHFLAGISYAFLQRESWDQLANVLRSLEILHNTVFQLNFSSCVETNYFLKSVFHNFRK